MKAAWPVENCKGINEGGHPRKIMFINSPVDASRYEWEYSLGSRLPPIGLCSLAAYTRRHGFKTGVLDAYNLGLSQGAALKRVLEFSPTHVGITATTSYIFFAAQLAKLIKESSPQIVTIIGGAHISAAPQETMQRYPYFDIGVLGEGEETIAEILKLPQIRDGLGNVRGIIYRDERGNLKKTEIRPYLDDLDKLPYPAWDSLPGFPGYYRPSPTNYRKIPVASLVTSRGCPYQCRFCDRSVFGNRYRSFSAEYIIGAIEELKYKYGIREISFYDDAFTVDKIRLNILCEYFIRNKLRVSWSCLGRVDLADCATLRLMKKAGCWLISYGIESTSQEILDLYEKKINLSQIEEALKITNAEGIRTRGFFMLGSPLETDKSIAKMNGLLRRLALDDMHISFFTPFPGSELYGLADRYGDFSKDWQDMDSYSLNFVPFGLNRDLLLKYRADLYRDFYFRPRRMLRYSGFLLNPKRAFETFKKSLVFLKLTGNGKRR